MNYDLVWTAWYPVHHPPAPAAAFGLKDPVRGLLALSAQMRQEPTFNRLLS